MKKLSSYQEKICNFRASGNSLREIGEKMGRSEGTVKNDFMRIRKILGTPSEEEIFQLSWRKYLREKDYELYGKKLPTGGSD